jgi:hypothetical protein
MIRTITIGTVALALVTGIGCDRNRQETPSSTTNTTSGDNVREPEKTGTTTEPRVEDKGVTRTDTLAHDGGHVTTTGANVEKGTEKTTAEARRETAEDKADFMKKRADYKASVTKDIADADKRIAKLEERVTTEKDPGDRARIQHALPAIKAKREALKHSLDSIDSSTAATWENTKNHVGESWNDLKRAIDDAAR